MSRFLIQFGLWTVLIVLGGAVVREFALEPNSPLRARSGTAIQFALIAGGVFVVAGVVLVALEKLFGPETGRCVVCGSKVPQGEIYCKVHLREILEDEDKRSHKTAARD